MIYIKLFTITTYLKYLSSPRLKSQQIAELEAEIPKHKVKDQELL